MTNISRYITDLDIQALVDNELDWEDQKRVRKAIECNAYFLVRYEELKKQKAWMKHLTEDPFKDPMEEIVD